MADRRSVRIQDLERKNRPRERMLAQGARVLTDGELLAILLGTGTQDLNAIQLAEALIRELGGLQGLQNASLQELVQRPGIGLAKASRIKASLALAQRLSQEGTEAPSPMSSPEDFARRFGAQMGALEKEEVWVVWVNARNHVIGHEELYRGSQDASSARVAEIFQKAGTLKAHGICVLHNHPSGDTSESPDDLVFTRSLIEAGRILDIRVLDHLIIGRDAFRSLRQAHPELWR